MCVCLFINLQLIVKSVRAELDASLLAVLVRFVYLHAAKWLLAVLVTTSGWHSEPGNQAVGELGGSTPNGLLEIIPKLSMNYPPELRHSSQALSIDGTGKRESFGRRSVCVACVVRGRFGWSSVAVCVIECVFVCVCVRTRSMMILAVLVHWGNGAC